MPRDLERLLESLITDISCYGDLGCTVSHVLESLGTFYQDDRPNRDKFLEPTSTEINQLLWSTAWDWLRARRDISVGASRKWNHLSLLDLLAVPDPDCQDESAASLSKAVAVHTSTSADNTQPIYQGKMSTTKDLPRKRPRIYVSEDRMWESIAGHAPDYRRVPRLEWMALVGIASTKQQGILQGDLGRLVGQDKRSLPKRTDALAEKGYISKRTTLVRGTKTSKMWLTRFAPALPTDPTKTTTGIPATVDMSRDALACDLEPVPWRGRWTGDSVDYISLAQTIMAVVKAYRIIRYHDLRRKLGILGLRWQMKVAAKTCRFFVQTGAIQYVGATLSGKLFKDCLKFDHDLTHEDWATYLATGKQKSSSFASSGLGDVDLYAADGIGPSASVPDSAPGSPTSGPRRGPSKKRVNSCAGWAAEKPLTTTVFDSISAAGATGLSNKQIGDSTLGSSFRRYLSSISATLAISTLQPHHLCHFQVLGEMHRKGKSQQYRYFAPYSSKTPESQSSEGHENEDEAIDDQTESNAVTGKTICCALPHIFAAPTLLPNNARAVGGLTSLAQGPGKGASSSLLKRKAELPEPQAGAAHGLGSRVAKRTILSEQISYEAPDDNDFSPGANIGSGSAPSSRITTRQGTRSRLVADAEMASLVVTLKVKPTALFEAFRARIKNLENEITVEGRPAVSDKVDEESFGCNPGLDASKDAAPAKEALANDETTEETPVLIEALDSEESIIVAPGGSPNEDVGENAGQVGNEDSAQNLSRKRGGRRKRNGAQNPRRGRSSVVKCEKCGGTWKNDVGLKYHLEKSRSTCNPSYVQTQPLPLAHPESLSRPSMSAKQYATSRSTPARHTISPTSSRCKDSARSQVRYYEQNPVLAEEQDQAGPKINLASKSELGPHANTPSGGRNMQTPRSKRSNASLQTRFGARSSMTGHHVTSKSSPSLRPPVSSSANIVASGLIDDRSGNVRNMPAEHATAQPALKRQRTEETLRPHALATSTDSRGKWLTGTTEADESLPSNSMEDGRNFGRRDQGLAQDSRISPSASRVKVAQTSIIRPSASKLSHVEAVRTDIHGNGALANPNFDSIERVIMYILRANDGVFPGGQSVWYAVLATWEIAFPAEPVPSHQSYKDAIAKLAKRRQIVVSTHAFKDSRGMMANYQLLRIPGVEASSPAGAATKAKITAAYPKPYTPPAFIPKIGLPTEDNHVAQPVFSSRRKLIRGIEVLDAPFYANQAANEKGISPHDGTNQAPRKRRRRMVTREQIAQAEDEGPDGTRRRDIFRFFMDDTEEANDGLGLSSASGDGRGCSAPRLVFLNPNTYLGQDVPEDVRRTLLPDRPLPEPTYPALHKEDGDISGFEVSFTETNVIVGRDGAWPVPENELFEAENRSLTISGWMPDSRWFLRQSLPQNLADIIKWRGYPQARIPNCSECSEFDEQVDACFDWELSNEGMKLMLSESVAPDYIFINLGIEDLPGEWKNPPLEWTTANQLSPSALFDVRISEQTMTATDQLWGGDLGRQKRRKRRQKQPGAEAKELVVGIDLKIRSLTTLPKDTDLRDGVKRGAGLDQTNETILIAAFVATRTLLGGADRIIEWGLMMTLFPEMALSAMRRFWSKARKDRKTFINQLTERFQVQFISAYESNEFPPIDFDDYVDYDWTRLIKWTAGLIEDSAELPASKADLDQGYSLAPAWADVDNWRDDYYNFQMSVFNRFEAATSRPAVSFVDEVNEAALEAHADDLVTAMSWIRSLCYAPPDRYAPHDIRKKMASIGDGNEERIQLLLEQAVETLQGQGVITDSKLKALEGRPYRLTETFLPRFMKWTHEQKFLDAARFKSSLDGSFRRGEKIRIPYVLKDGEVMAMMNMQANGRVAITAVDVPRIPLGFDPGNYESRKYPKSYYNFGLEIGPTEAYVYDEDLELLQHARNNRPPQENQHRAIPLWSDFFGELNIERWSQVLGAVAFVIATRGPLSVGSVCAILKPYLQEFEVQMVFDWGRCNGVLKGMDHYTSCTVDEWWWLLVGRQREVALS